MHIWQANWFLHENHSNNTILLLNIIFKIYWYRELYIGPVIGKIRNIYVVVQYYPWFKFSFLLFQTHYHITVIPKKQKSTKFEPRIKLNHNMYYVVLHQQFQVKLPHLQSAWHQEETLQYLKNYRTKNNRDIMNPDYSDSRIEEKEPQFYPKNSINPSLD